MSEKLAQPTEVLIQRLRRAAKVLRRNELSLVQAQAFANTCDQAAGRLEDLFYRASDA